MALQLGAFASMGRRVRVDASFANAAGLTVGAAVQIAGVQVGAVEELTIDHDRAAARLALTPSVGVRRDALVRIRARSVLGEKYVEILPQSRDAELAETGDLLVTASEQTEVDQLINLMGPLIQAMQPDRVAHVIEVFDESLEGDPERVSRMLTNLDALLANSAQASEALPGLVDEAGTTLAQGRGTLTRMNARLDESKVVVARADGVLQRLDSAAEPLPELIGDAGAAITDARELLDHLDASTDEVELILQNAAEIDKEELRRLLRDEGVLVRIRRRRVASDSSTR